MAKRNFEIDEIKINNLKDTYKEEEERLIDSNLKKVDYNSDPNVSLISRINSKNIYG